jgi:hypothetical protein
MTKELSEVRSGAAVRTVPLTLKEIRLIAANAFAGRLNERFPTLHRIEHQADRDNASTMGTVLQPVVDALNTAGVVTSSTVGGVMKSLEVSFDDLHAETCNCVNDGELSGQHAAGNFGNLAKKAA